MGRNWGAFLSGSILAVFAGSCIPPEPPPPICEAKVSLEQVLVTPTRITPDGNGIFDDASIRALVRVNGLGPTCGGLDDLMLDFLDVEVDLVAGGGQGATIRQFREAVPLTVGLCENEECSARIGYTWDGRDSRGRVLPDGERVVPVLHASLAVLAEPSGQPRTLASSQQTASAITVSAKHDAAEDAWLEVQAIEASIGKRAEDPTALPSDWPYRYEDASAATLAALADASARARHLDLPTAFDERLQHVLADSHVTVKPDASQIAAWQKVFLDSRGSTEVEWGDRGAPEAIWLLDAGASQGDAAQVAKAYLLSKEPELRALLGMAADESWRFHQVIGAGADPIVAVRYWHDVRVGQAPPSIQQDELAKEQSIPVAGDELLIWVRRSGVQKGTARVLNLTARWTRNVARPGVLLPTEIVDATAIVASGLPNAAVVKRSDPVLVSSGPSDRHVHVSVLVAGGPELLEVGIDAETDRVCYVRDGRRENRLTANFNPATQDTMYGFTDTTSGMPHARICPRGATRADQCVETDATGFYDPAVLGPGGTVATVHLHGRYYREYSVDLDAPAYLLHPRYSTVIDATRPTTDLHLDHLTTGIADWATKEYLTRNMLIHLNYQMDLYTQLGLGIDDRGGLMPRAQLFVDWGPRGTSFPCDDSGGVWAAHAYCRDCEAGECRSDVYQPLTCSGAGDTVCQRLDAYGFSHAFCDFSYGTCDWGPKILAYATDGCDNAVLGGAAGSCDLAMHEDLVPGACRYYPDLGTCLHVDPNYFICKQARGCDDGSTAFLERQPWSDTYALHVTTHEGLHHAAPGPAASGHIDDGTLDAFLTEGFPELASRIVYPQLALWANRDNLVPVDLEPKYLGDPVAGGRVDPSCYAPGEQDPTDSYYCPTRDRFGDLTPTCERRACYFLAELLLAAGCCGPSSPDGCPAGIEAPWGMVCKNGRPYRPDDVHWNSAWFQAAMIRYATMVGREKGMRDILGLLRAGIRGEVDLSLPEDVQQTTTVATGMDSLYYKLFTSARYLTPGKENNAEAWPAFAANVSGAAAPEPIDRESGLPHHGNFVPTKHQAWRLGEMVADGRIDGPYDSDAWNAYLYAGRTYRVGLGTWSAGDLGVYVRYDDSISGRRVAPCYAASAPRSDLVVPRTDGGFGEGVFVPPADGVYSFQVFVAWGRGVPVAGDYVLSVGMSDDLPDRPDQAVPVVQDLGLYAGVLEADRPVDVDTFSIRLQAAGPGAVRVPARFYVPGPYRMRLRIVVRDPTGREVGRCFGPGYPSPGCTLIINPSGLEGAYSIEVRRLPLATPPTAIPYWFQISPLPGLLDPKCLWPTPPTAPPSAGGVAPAGCGLSKGPAYAGVTIPGTPDDLWFYAEPGYILGLGASGSVDVAVHQPTYRDEKTGVMPGTSVQPLFERSAAWAHQIAFVAPVAGWYRATVTPVDDQPTGYQIRFFQSRYQECDLPTILETTGGP